MTKKILLFTLSIVAFAAVLTIVTTAVRTSWQRISSSEIEAIPGLDLFAQAGEQRRILPLKVVYHNKRTDRDTCSNTADTLRIGVIGAGSAEGLAPVGIALQFTAEDADVSATPDSMDVTYRAGIGGKYATVGAKTLTVSGSLPGVTTRTLVLNTTGAAAALNTQAAVWPWCDAIELWIQDGSLDTDDSLRYTVKAFGIYESGRFYARIPVVYKNKGQKADSAAGTTVDTTRIGVTQFGDAAPLGVSVLIFAKDVDVSAAADTLLVASFGSVDGKNFYNLATATFFGEAMPITNGATATGIRTYVFNTTGAATARAAQGTIAPYFRALELRAKADDAGDTTLYSYNVMGIYRKN